MDAARVRVAQQKHRLLLTEIGVEPAAVGAAEVRLHRPYISLRSSRVPAHGATTDPARRWPRSQRGDVDVGGRSSSCS